MSNGLAGEEGIEPSHSESKSDVLPLDYSPMCVSKEMNTTRGVIPSFFIIFR